MSGGRLALCVAALLLVSARADAAQCGVDVTSIVFGSYDVFVTTHTDSTGTIVLNCNGGAKNVEITINQGGGPSFAERRLSKGTEWLYYNVYLDASRTTIWGNGNGGSEAQIIAN